MELQTTYWRKQVGELAAQAEEMRTLTTKVTADVAGPIKAQVTRGMKGLHKATPLHSLENLPAYSGDTAVPGQAKHRPSVSPPLHAFQPSWPRCCGSPGVDLSDLLLVPRMRRIQRQSVETYAVLHRLCSLLCQRLSAVAWLTQSLPVATIPEQPEISIVRHNVIDLCG